MDFFNSESKDYDSDSEWDDRSLYEDESYQIEEEQGSKEPRANAGFVGPEYLVGEPHGFRQDEPIFEGCPITILDSAKAILAYSLKHNQSNEALADLLDLIKLFCPPGHKCISSVYKFNQIFDNFQSSAKRFFFCSVCEVVLEQNSNLCSKCGKDVDKDNNFVGQSVAEQIKKLFTMPHFQDQINYRFERRKKYEANYEDIYDGEIYQKFSQEGEILTEKSNLSYLWYTDGIKLFKGSKKSLWVFLLINNELPYIERYKIENVIFVSLWHADSKPIPKVFLSQLKLEVRTLYAGINNVLPDQNARVRNLIIGGVCDLPAKSLFLNMKQYNGRFGCCHCKIEGRSENGRWTYPYSRNLKLRSTEETLMHVQQALESGGSVCGVKGPSILGSLVPEYIESTAVDSMHCAFEGIVSFMMTLWFDVKYKDEPFSLYKQRNLINQRLCNIKPPSYVQRRPRSILEHLPYWKASEFKNWLLYYSLFILKDLMALEYFEHFKLLVMSLILLSRNSISPDMLAAASTMLNEFSNRFETLYDGEHMRPNLHQLQHLPDTVKKFGPLWITTCFPMEDLNGKMKYLVKSSNGAELQILSKITMIKDCMKRIEESEPSAVNDFCRRMIRRKRQYKLLPIAPHLCIAGTLKKPKKGIFDQQVLELIGNKNVFTFSRLFKHHQYYTSKSYTREKLYNSSVVKFQDEGAIFYGQIEYFFKISDCDCKAKCSCPGTFWSKIDCFHITDNKLKNVYFSIDDYMGSYNKRETYPRIVEVQNLICVCFFLDFHKETNYVIESVNAMEDE